ncbi:glycoside hydrolase family 104 protein [Acinetobacter sp. YH12140]|uniref:glycoside hydrolase family 24 protein n=1 Tax=Acinetobacter sp. YH12140 TaxID=2601124 RepID=UPI0015D18388|nr:glycoside hydrolase family 104 protein [Acinetobacter sp. YH12140]
MVTRQEIEQYLKNPNVRKMLGVIASAEGVKHGYHTMFGNERLSDLSKHPGILKEFTQTDGKKNKTSAAGRYQFLGPTWNSLAKQLGLKDFSPKSQDIAAVALLAQNGALPHVLKGDIPTAVKKSGGTWASLPSAPDSYKQPKKTWSDIGMSGSTFDRVKSKRDAQKQPTIADVYKAYRGGKLTTEQKNAFESDVKAGKVMLPSGAKLMGQKKAVEPVMLPQNVSDAYYSGRLSNQQREALERDLKDNIVKLPMPTSHQSSVPDFDANGNIIEPQMPKAPPQQAPLSTMDKIIGGAEAGLTLATGAVGGAIGQAAGGLHGIAESVIDGTFGTQQGAQNAVNRATQLSNALTYEPRTAGGRRAVGAVGEFIEDSGLDTLPPVLGGGVGTTTATLGRASVPVATTAAREVTQAAKPVVAQAVEQAKRPVTAVTEAAKNAFNRESSSTGPAPANIGAAQVDPATVRQALAADLPITPELTKGQISRDPAQLKFEVETAKDGEMGAPLRQRYEQQHQAIQQNFDAFIDQTGSQTGGNARDVGLMVDGALQKQMQNDKNRVRVAYNKADKSEEASTPVDVTRPVSVLEDGEISVIDYLNSQPELPTTPIITAAKRTAVSLGIAQKADDGSLVPGNPTIKQLEKWRSEINGNVNQEAPNIRQATILKGFIDAHVDPYAGTLYKAARAERKRFGDKWEKHTIIKDLTSNKKGTDDRKVAYEKVVDRVIYSGSLDDLRQAKRTIMTAGPEGKQSWSEIQAAVLQSIKDEATKGVAPDGQGNQMISPAALNAQIRKLDDKLDFIFGKQGADKLRALNEVSKTIFTVPTSAAINHSNTAATLSAAMDLVLSGMSGFPAPVASALRISTKHIKDRKVRKRVEDALNPRS